MAPPPARLRHRIPVRIRHYWKLLAVCAAFAATFGVVFSSSRIVPLVTSSSSTSGDQITENVTGSEDLFDSTVAHSIEISYNETDYEKMLDEYFDDGSKDFVEADITIDGTLIQDVGIRLKGNSTLNSLTRDGESRQSGMGGGGGGGMGGQMPDGAQMPGQTQATSTSTPTSTTGTDSNNTDSNSTDSNSASSRSTTSKSADSKSTATSTTSAEPDATGGQDSTTGQQDAGRTGGGASQTTLKAEEPENLPWLIRFDEYVEGRTFQGHRDLSVRVGGQGAGESVLNESTSLQLLSDAGVPAEEYTYTSFTVNDRPTTSRLVVEQPDAGFADRLGDNGVLYKSMASGSWDYQGEDQTDYTSDFKQITMKGSQDLQPLINLLKWLDSADDEEFDEHLADYVDVDSFAEYVAAQNLLLNSDDMSGPGNNSYLWYDLDTKKFSVIGWDYNLTLSGNAEQDPTESASIGGGMGGGQGGGMGAAAGEGQTGTSTSTPTSTPTSTETDAGSTPSATDAQAGTGMQMPEGMTLPDGADLPDGMQMPGGDDDGGGGMGGGIGGNVLKEMFLDSDAFADTYQSAYQELYQKMFANNTAVKTLTAIKRVVRTVDGVDEDSLDSEVSSLRTVLKQRTRYLSTNDFVTG